MQHGFVRVACAVPPVHLANPMANLEEIDSLARQAERRGAEFVVFPEMALTGYTCADLFQQDILIREAERALACLLERNAASGMVCLVGMPVRTALGLINAAVVTQGDRILGVVPKTYIPNYKEFQERRWFVSAEGRDFGSVTLAGRTHVPVGRFIFESAALRFGVEVCEDIWAPCPPSVTLAQRGAQIVFNLSASNELVGKHGYTRGLVVGQSARCLCGYVYVSSGWGESSQDLVFGGRTFIAENGVLLAEGRRFGTEPQLVCSEIDVAHLNAERLQNTTFTDGARGCPPVPAVPFREAAAPEPGTPFTLSRAVDAHPFVPEGPALDERCEEIFSIQSLGLARRVRHTHAKSLVIGISGGLDSTLALLVAVRTCDLLRRPRTDIIGVTMPGFGTTSRTHDNALTLLRSLGATIREISIAPAVSQHFADIGHDPQNHDVTYENAQARERTQILFDVANQTGGLVVGTGDLSELALGWATYNGDHMSSYGVNASVPKTLVRHLVTWVANHSDNELARATLLDVVDTPVSPELLPADSHGNIQQKTEDLVGPYELHDFFLYHFVRNGFAPGKILFLARHAFGRRYDEPTVRHWLGVFCRRFFAQQFKRSCIPDGPKVGSVSLSPRGDWRMPTDAQADIWKADLENAPDGASL